MRPLPKSFCFVIEDMTNVVELFLSWLAQVLMNPFLVCLSAPFLQSSRSLQVCWAGLLMKRGECCLCVGCLICIAGALLEN